MKPDELKTRTERFSDAIVMFCVPLLERRQTQAMADQLLRSGTAVDSNYGSAQRARTNREFVAKLGQVLDDVSESLGWLKRLNKPRLAAGDELNVLLKECDELTRIFARSCGTARQNHAKRTQDAARARRSAKVHRR